MFGLLGVAFRHLNLRSYQSDRKAREKASEGWQADVTRVRDPLREFATSAFPGEDEKKGEAVKESVLLIGSIVVLVVIIPFVWGAVYAMGGE